MAIANPIKLKNISDSGQFVNNFAEYTAIAPVELAIGAKWFIFKEKIYTQRSAYLYLSGEIDQDVVVQLYRTGGVDTTDTDLLIPIPGATLTMTVTVPGTPERVAIDFNIDNFGADQLYMKCTGAAGLSANLLDIVNLILKP